jgi:hypothetical protein
MNRSVTLGIAVVAAVVLTVVASSTCARAQEAGNSLADLAYGFKGVKWGATKEEFHAIRPNVALGLIDFNPEKFLAYDVGIKYCFTAKGRWACMMIEPASDDVMDLITKELVNHFGTPPGGKYRWQLDTLDIMVLGNWGVIRIDALVDGKWGVYFQ